MLFVNFLRVLYLQNDLISVLGEESSIVIIDKGELFFFIYLDWPVSFFIHILWSKF